MGTQHDLLLLPFDGPSSSHVLGCGHISRLGPMLRTGMMHPARHLSLHCLVNHSLLPSYRKIQTTLPVSWHDHVISCLLTAHLCS
jgi:hypothetical protein